jgi:hypothetical protein
MEKVSQSKVGRLVDKLHVESEPGLTTTQLMLTNHDLKPVEPARRQWGAWNFVGFWVGKLRASRVCRIGNATRLANHPLIIFTADHFRSQLIPSTSTPG